MALRTLIESTGADIARTLYLSQMVESDTIQLPNGDELPGPVPLEVDALEQYASYVDNGLLLAHVAEAISACDVVFINGEGSIYDAQVKGLMQLFIIYLARKVFNRPVVLANFTAELTSSSTQEIARVALPMCDDIVFREPLSEAHVHSIVGKLDSITGADAAFIHEPMDQASWRRIVQRRGYHAQWPDNHKGLDLTRPYACLAGSSIYYRPDRPLYNPVPAFLELALRLIARGLQVVCCVPGRTDGKIFDPLIRELGLPRFSVTTPTPQAIDLLANAAILISGRWHPSILAAKGGTPPVMLTANTHKTTALPTQLGLDAPAFDALTLREQVPEILELVDHYVEEGNRLRRSIRRRAQQLAGEARKNVRFLEQHVPTRRNSGDRRADQDDSGLPLQSKPSMDAALPDPEWWLNTKVASIRQIVGPARQRWARNLLKEMETKHRPEAGLIAAALEAAIAHDDLPFGKSVAALGEREAAAALLWLGKSLVKLRDEERAEAAYRAVLAFRPTSRAAHQRLAEMMIARGMHAEAIEHLSGYVSVTRGTNKYVELLAEHAVRAGRAPEALQALERLLAGKEQPRASVLEPFVASLPTLVAPAVARDLLGRIRARAPHDSPLRAQADDALSQLSSG